MSNEKIAEDANSGISHERKKLAKALDIFTKKVHSEPLKRIDLFANAAYNVLRRVVSKPDKQIEKELETEGIIENELPKQESFKFVRKITFAKIEEEIQERKPEELNTEEDKIEEPEPEEFKEAIIHQETVFDTQKKLEPIEEKIDEFLEKIKLDPIEEIKPEIVDLTEEDEVIENNIATEEIQNILEAIETAEITKEKLTNQIRQLVIVKYETIQNKATKLLLFCNHFEKENKDLEQQVVQVIRESFESIDEIKDSVRRESLKENEVGYKMQKLKTRLLELEEINNKVGKYLKEADGQYTEIGLATIRELEHKLKPLEYQYKNIENQYFSLMQEQSEHTSTLNFRTRILKITRADKESDYKKLQTHYHNLQQRKKEILQRLEYAKEAMQENSMSETNKYNKMTEELRELSEKAKIMLREKISLENENNYLQEKIHKVLHELDFLPE